MDTHPKKLSPFQGITLLFLLLVIPVGVYVGSQYSSIADTRNKAAGPPDVSQRPAMNSAPVAVAPVAVAPVVAKTPIPISSPTPTKTMTQWCNADCATDTGCGTGMVCALVEGKGVCRNAQCFGAVDCWCYKVEGSPTPINYCNKSCVNTTECGGSMICTETADGTSAGIHSVMEIQTVSVIPPFLLPPLFHRHRQSVSFP